jgi:hypothetical protein
MLINLLYLFECCVRARKLMHFILLNFLDDALLATNVSLACKSEQLVFILHFLVFITF